MAGERVLVCRWCDKKKDDHSGPSRCCSTDFNDDRRWAGFWVYRSEAGMTAHEKAREICLSGLSGHRLVGAIVDAIQKAEAAAARIAYESAAERCGAVGYSQSASSQVEYFRAKAAAIRG